MNNDKLPYSVIRQAANELLVKLIMVAIHRAASMLASDCEISLDEARSVLAEKLVQVLTKFPARQSCNPDIVAVYLNIDISEDDSAVAFDISKADNELSPIGSFSWLADEDESDSDEDSGLVAA